MFTLPNNQELINGLWLGAIMFLYFLMWAVNTRAIVLVRWGSIALTDALLCVLNFTMIQKVADAKTLTEQVCYTVGGVAGALAGVWISRRWSSSPKNPD